MFWLSERSSDACSSGIQRTRIGRIVRTMLGLTLAVLGCFSVCYGIRVARAQVLYHAIKYGQQAQADPELISTKAEKAYALYPHNYFLCLYVAEQFWPKSSGPEADISADAVERFDRWYERGLTLNPYHWRLHRAKTRSLSLTSADAAADYWAQFVDWQFWSPANLSFLVTCYARSGRFVEAAETLSLLKGYPGHYARAAAALRTAWAAEMAP